MKGGGRRLREKRNSSLISGVSQQVLTNIIAPLTMVKCSPINVDNQFPLTAVFVLIRGDRLLLVFTTTVFFLAFITNAKPYTPQSGLRRIETETKLSTHGHKTLLTKTVVFQSVWMIIVTTNNEICQSQERETRRPGNSDSFSFIVLFRTRSPLGWQRCFLIYLFIYLFIAL